MKIPMLKEVRPFIILLAVLHFISIQIAHSSERNLSEADELWMQVDDLKKSGYYSKAIPIIENLLALQRKGVEGNNADVARSLDLLGELHYLAGKYREAEPFLTEALTIRKEIFGPDHLETAESYNHLGVYYTIVWKHDKANSFLKKATRIREKAYGPNHPDVAEALLNLSRMYLNTENRDEAETLLKQVLVIQENSLGPEHPDLVETLNTFAWLHIDTDDYEKAEPFSKRALAISENTFGPEHPYVADSLNYLGRLYYARQKHEKSISANKRALAIREEFLGPSHPDVGLSLNNLALPHCGIENYSTAKTLFVRALSIRETIFGAEHPSLLVMLQNTGWVHGVLGDYTQAVFYYEQALRISERINEPESIEVADKRKDLAGIYHALGNYDKAETLLNDSLKVHEKTLGPDHPRVASNLTSQAFIAQTRGDFPKAEDLYKRSIEICKKHFDRSPTNLASNLSNLAALYVDMGHYEKAEPYYQQALEILEKTIGTEHSLVAYILNNMGRLYSILADYEKAESIYNQSLAIWEKVFGPDHPNLAVTLDNLAMLYEEREQFDKAEPLYQRALQIRETALGPKHPDVSKTLNNLATLYDLTGDYEKAVQLYQRSLKIKEETVGTENTSYANSLHNLAATHLKLGDSEKAEKLHTQALEIWLETLGPDHQNVSTAYGHLSQLYAGRGDFEKAYGFVIRSMEIDNKLIDQVIGFTSEDQKLQFVVTNNWNLHYYLNLVNQHYSDDPLKRKNALDVWLKRKGIILDVQKRYQEAGITTGNIEIVKLFEELSSVQARLSKLTFSKPGITDTENYKQKKSDLENEKDQLESQLSRISKPFALKQKVTKANSEQIAKVLPPETVLVEFARIETSNLKSTEETNNIPHYRYITFVLHAGSGDKVGMIDLGGADRIDSMIARYKKALSESGNGNGELASKTSKELYDLVFRPLLKDLENTKNIFMSPDGNLSLIPFEVLQKPNGKFLIEEYTFNYLAAGRDLVGFKENPSAGNTFLFMGAPDFGMEASTKMSFINNGKIDRKKLLTKRSFNLNELSFEPLHYAKAELEAIGKIMGRNQSEIYMGKEALEETLMNTTGPEILHLATHGFFLSGRDSPGSGRGWQAADLLAMDDNSSNLIEGKINVENPLLRSGILLAGAKRSLTEGGSGNNDGIVTAAEILGLNLHGTKMVVLSACDTGLGEVKSGEGVFGLRRAFTQAGAKSLVMSLWKVPDRETKELMVQFYRNIKSGTMNRCQALRQAILDQMETVRKRYGYANPRYWGAFVFMGES